MEKKPNETTTIVNIDSGALFVCLSVRACVCMCDKSAYRQRTRLFDAMAQWIMRVDYIMDCCIFYFIFFSTSLGNALCCWICRSPIETEQHWHRNFSATSSPFHITHYILWWIEINEKGDTKWKKKKKTTSRQYIPFWLRWGNRCASDTRVQLKVRTGTLVIMKHNICNMCVCVL